jgi:hypothetical protein
MLGATTLYLSLGLPARARAASATASAVSAQTNPQSNQAESAPSEEGVVIDGPLRSFLRMAGISQKISADDVLPLLSRNVFAQGYQDRTRPTEFLLLLGRYVHQARELRLLATPGDVIRVSNCVDAGPLLRVLGYRLRQDCGQSGTSLETADAERAFLTIDSGFPLSELEQTLQGGPPFAYPFPATRVPVLFSESEWIAAGKKGDHADDRNLVDAFLGDPSLARLYWALSRMDPETRTVLRQTGLRKLIPSSAALDFYGGHLSIRSGRVVVPGGEASEAAWKDLVGASPASPGVFVQGLMQKDKSWLAAYFDVLSRSSQSQQAYFTEPHRLRSFYEALRTHDLSADATRGSYRPAPALLLLVTRLQRDPSGEALVPGNLAIWKDILRQRSDSGMVRAVGRRTRSLNSPADLVQAMFALARANTDVGPLQIYLALTELETRRKTRLAPETVRALARKFPQFSSQYPIFCEFPELSDASITGFLEIAENLDTISNNTLRGNALGTFQASVGIWQILARQDPMPSRQLNGSWQAVIRPFNKVRSAAQLYDAGRASLAELFRATGQNQGSQDEMIELLAGPPQTAPDAKQMRRAMANRIRSVLASQRLVSLDTLMALGDGLNAKAEGKSASESLIRLAGELREFEMPQPIFTGSEREEWAAGIYNNHHTELQMRTDVAKVLQSAASRTQLEAARGELASFLRDTLVGLNYAYYEPPGAQALHNNPLFVRSHDFSGETVAGIRQIWQTPQLFGEGSPAGGGAHLVGSLADLPYVLAEIEQDFIAPENVQALIWRELVPGLLISAVLPRWWGVGRHELHAVTLYQRSGEELLRASAKDPQLREKAMTILSDRMLPQTSARLGLALSEDRIPEILPRLTPADTFYLAAEFRRRFPGEAEAAGEESRELGNLSRAFPDELRWERLSRDFGVPHPALAQTYARELLNLPPLPAFSGYSSRLLAESWESCNLYWARLADENGYPPEALNHLVPELTQRMVEKVFATDFEDWPALLRAMRETGEEFRQGRMAAVPVASGPSRP